MKGTEMRKVRVVIPSTDENFILCAYEYKDNTYIDTKDNKLYIAISKAVGMAIISMTEILTTEDEAGIRDLRCEYIKVIKKLETTLKNSTLIPKEIWNELADKIEFIVEMETI